MNHSAAGYSTDDTRNVLIFPANFSLLYRHARALLYVNLTVAITDF